MRLRHFATLAVLTLSSSMAFADSSVGAVSGGVKAAGGVLAAGGAAGTVAVVTNLFSNSTKREALAVTKAPEISTSGITAGLILLAGGILIARGRRTQNAAE